MRLGDMRELGPRSPRLHAELARAIAEAKVDRVYLAGPLMRSDWGVACRRGRLPHKNACV